MNDNLYTDAAQLVTTFADPVNTVNGLESELVALRRQYADQSDELVTAQDERDALMKLTVNLHEMLSEAGVPPNGTLSERMKLAFERTEQAWLAARLFEKAFDEAEAERRAAAAAARRWKAAAKTFRRRWRDSCAELADGRKPIYRLIEWLQAVHLYPTDVFETSDHYTFYASFEEPIAGTTLRALTGMNLKVETTPIRNRYMIQFVPSPDDEV